MSRSIRIWFHPLAGLALASLSVLGGLTGVVTAERFDFHSIRRDARPATTGHYEGELHYARQENAREQDMQHYGPEWSGGAHFLWDGMIGDAALVRFRVPRKSEFQLTLQFTRASDYGVFQITLDGQPIGDEVDLFAPQVELGPPVDLGKVILDEGSHSLTFRLTGGNERAKKFRDRGYLLGLDFFRLVDLAPPSEPAARVVSADVMAQTIDMSVAKTLLAKYCLRCHDGDEPKGEMALAMLQTRQDLLDDLEQTEQIADALWLGVMPPDTEPQPSPEERKQLADFFGSVLEESVLGSDALEPVVMRRLTRYEYNNAVRDLLQLRGDIYPLPERTLRADREYFNPITGMLPDVIRVGNRTLGKNQVEKQILDGVSPFAIDLQAEHGFNNRGDQMSVSPLLLETFVQLGESIVNSPQFPDYCQVYNQLFAGVDPPDRQHDLQLARKRLLALLERAFRQPIDEPTLNRYFEFFAAEYDRGVSFAGAMRKAVTAVLASPRFLFLVKSAPQQSTASQLSDYELATKLSFFLWSTIPDSELLGLAKRQRLGDPDVLERQVQRMLLDRRSQALSENFARQWLRLDQLITAVPDIERFPRYYARIGCEQWKFGLQTMVEPLLLFESIVVEDRSIMLLIDSNYSYRSDELQSWYEDAVPFVDRGNVNRFNTNQQNFVRRDLSSRRQGGVITTAATLTMTSSPLRTSPITRGAWVATVILNQPPAPPPDVVPEIEADDNAIEAQGITLRERLKQHQVSETCAACHAKIDPLGFVLENYDAVGRWRDQYRSGLPIDASGKLFGDAKFEDIEGFKDILLDRPTIFMRAFTEHLLSYALGRELRPIDKPTVDRIVRRVAADHGRLSTLVTEIVKSRSFRHKTNQKRRTAK